MTRTERDALIATIVKMESPVVDWKEIPKLDSEDFKLGWQRCQERYAGLLEFLLHGKPKDIKRYAQ